MKFGSFFIRCKTCENGNESYHLEHFNSVEPTNQNELSEVLNQNFPTYIDALIYMPCSRYENMDSSIFHNLPKKTFD